MYIDKILGIVLKMETLHLILVNILKNIHPPTPTHFVAEVPPATLGHVSGHLGSCSCILTQRGFVRVAELLSGQLVLMLKNLQDDTDEGLLV